MSTTNTLDETNPIAFMLFVGAGTILGSILSQLLFKSEQCPIENTSAGETQIKIEQTRSTMNELT